MGVISKAPSWLLQRIADSSARAVSGRSSDLPVIKTADHPEGMAIAKLLGAKDCKTYWRFDCPRVPAHKTPVAVMYPRLNGEVRFVCYSTNSCSHSEIAAAVKEKLK